MTAVAGWCPLGSCHILEDISEGLATSTFGQLRDLVFEAVGQVAESLATLWVSVPTISVTASAGGSSPSGTVEFIQRSLWIVTIALLAVSLMVGGARMAFERRGEPFIEVLKGLLTFVFISSGGLFALGLVLSIVDELSEWILDRSVQGTDFGQNLGLLLTFPTSQGLGILMGTILGVIAVLVSIMQICLMVLRAAILPVLAGLWPTAAAFSGTASGKAWLQKLTSWIVAFAFYKLAVAIIYATAFRLMGEDLFAADGTGLVQALAGVLLMIVAVVALPALVRLIAPMTAAVAGGGGGGAGMAALGGAAMLASGAVHSGSSNSSPSTASGAVGSGGGAGPAGPAGSQGSGSQPTKSSNSAPAGGGAGMGAPTQSSGSGAAGGAAPAGAPASVGAGTGGGAAAGAGAGAAAGGSAAAGAGAAAAAGPAAPAVLGAQAALGAAQAVQSQVKQSAEGAMGGPTGAQ